MNKEYYDQLELFSQTNSRDREKTGFSKAFIAYISKYEKIILIIIGFVITGIVSFSLGVKKGKSIIMIKTDTNLDVASKPQPKVILPAVAAKQVTEGQQYQTKQASEFKEYFQNYTVQVASFMNRINAQKEADVLKRKGLSPVVLPKGKFCIVCVGNFSKREEAESLLSRLKKQYQDCRIRRL